jgi:hypothetical protein
MSGQRTITSTVLHPDGSAWSGGRFHFTPKADTFTQTPDATYPIETVVATTESDGSLTVILASGLSTSYTVKAPDGETFDLIVPDGSAATLEALRAATVGAALPQASIEAIVAAYLAANGALTAVTDTGSIDLTKTSGTLSAAAIFGTTTGTVAQGDHTHTAVGVVNRTIGDGVNVIPTGVVKGDIYIPTGLTLTVTGWTLLADQSGSMVVDIWSDTYANYPPTVADTITASAKPTITTATKGQSSTLTGWTTSLAGPRSLRLNVDSATSITLATLALAFTRPV